MDRQNITLSLPRELIRRAKIAAAERGTSVTALVADLLDHEVGGTDEDRRLWERELEVMREGLGYRVPARVGRWRREDLHER